ncbi:MAG: carotenoid 1,2-hydratase [Deltaproteobacteria bacterium]|nr:carotenoid 1,2-hydratase [Deltaproteobacteria bacterium]MBW2283336.1 carotenoid 1,2-hydratase [Deltaproteobacteria bacterium]
MKRLSLFTLPLFILAFLCSRTGPPPAIGGEFLAVDGPCGLEFPKDHGAHSGYQTEWWYYTGNLESPDAKQNFGFQLTFFRVAIAPPGSERDWPPNPSQWRTRHLYMGHAALTDLKRSRFYYDERIARGAAGLAGVTAEQTGATVFLGNWSARLGKDEHLLHAKADGFSLDLRCVPAKPPVLHGIGGYSRKGARPQSASCYYSFTRLETTGTVSVGGIPASVTGTAWMDHEFSTAPLEKDLTGWDWFSIQLNDNTELMMFLLRQENGNLSPYSSGTFVDADGAIRHLTKADFQVTTLDRWRSPNTGAVYPSRRRIRVPHASLELDLSPNLSDQELITQNTTGVVYWEGSVSVKGTVSGKTVSGKGYVEMTGYAGPFHFLKPD